MTAKKKKSKKKKSKKKRLYHKFVMEKVMPISIIISNSDLSKLRTKARKDAFISVEDYIISLIECDYDNGINANSVLTIKTDTTEYDKNIHDLKVHKLDNPKLLTYKNDIKDNKQVTLDNYF